MKAMLSLSLILLRRDLWFSLLMAAVLSVVAVMFIAAIQPERSASSLIYGALALYLVVAAIGWFYLGDRLRALAAPEAFLLMPAWRSTVKTQLALQLVIWVLLPVACVALLGSTGMALGFFALLAPISAGVCYLGRDPRRVGPAVILFILFLWGLYSSMKQISWVTNPLLHAAVASVGVLMWVSVLRKLVGGHPREHVTFWRMIRRLELRGEATVRCEYHPDNAQSPLNRFEEAWSQKHRPVAGAPADSDHATAQLRWMLGPALRRKSPLNDVLGLATVVGVVLLVVWTSDNADQLFAVTASAFGMALGMVMHSWMQLSALKGSRYEQQVYRLLPGSGGPELHDTLLRTLMRRLLIESSRYVFVLMLVILLLAGIQWPWLLILSLTLFALSMLNLTLSRISLQRGLREGLRDAMLLGLPSFLVCVLMVTLYIQEALLPALLMAPLLMLIAQALNRRTRAGERLVLPVRG